MSLIDGGRWARRPPVPGAPRGFAPAMGAVCVLVVGGVLVGHLSGAATQRLRLDDFPLVAGITFTVVGALVVPRQPRNPIGWLLVAVGLCSGTALLGSSFGTVPLMAWLYSWSAATAYGLLPLVLLLFPDGRLPSRGWRAVAVLLGLATAVTAGALAVAAWLNPNLLSGGAGDSVLLDVARAGFVGSVLGVVAAIGALVVRWRRATGDVSQQLKWLALGAAFIPVGLAAQFLQVPGAWLLPAVTVPVAVGVAMLQYRLYDVDLYINRSLVYSVLTLILVAAYVAVVTTVGAIVDTGDEIPRLVAAGVVAVAFGPLRERLQRAANRLLYGDRDDPYAVVSRLSRRLEHAEDPATVLAQVAETVAEALHLPYAAIELSDAQGDPASERTVASHGRRAGDAEAFPMTYQGAVVGRLLVSPRSVSQPFTADERVLVEDLARQAGLAARTVRLTADLQRSRERLLRSREEERRRLRRDLHDGLGPALAGMTMQAGAARSLVTSDPAQVEYLLGELESQLQSCVKEIRQLVDNLVPSTLDRLGLVRAIQRRIDSFAMGGVRTIELTAPDDLPELPAAVELAAYFIATEAAANAVRHSGASTVTVRLAMEGGLVVDVTDDGSGIAADHRPGVGLGSMRERTAELGGFFHVGRPDGGGTRIHALLPLAGS